jgi:[ribosomal protein S18]-alanine N-acetyltransferase
MKEHALPACKLDSPDDLRFRVLTAEDAATILSWQYAPPYDFYNHAGPLREAVADLLRPEYGYHAIQCAQGRMIGYFCVGADARVPGSKYDNSALDLGMGLDPSLIGRGLGRMCVAAILDHLKTRLTNQPVRATVAAWNQPALRLCHQAGFVDSAEFEGPAGMKFMVLQLNPDR